MKKIALTIALLSAGALCADVASLRSQLAGTKARIPELHKQQAQQTESKVLLESEIDILKKNEQPTSHKEDQLKQTEAQLTQIEAEREHLYKECERLGTELALAEAAADTAAKDARGAVQPM